MMEATVITDVTPMTIPRMVSPDRTLCERRVSMATRRFSTASWRVMQSSGLAGGSACPTCHGNIQGRSGTGASACQRFSSFGPQGDHWVQLGRSCGWINTEEESDYG